MNTRRIVTVRSRFREYSLAQRWGQAKREVKALLPLISLRLAETTIRQIWMELQASGQVTVCQSKFYAQVKAQLTEKVHPATSQPAGRDLLTLAGSPKNVIAPVNRPDVTEQPPVEAGPTAAFVHDARSKNLDDQW